MTLNHVFMQPALVHATDQPWVLSTMAGVERRMLDRVSGELARVTSIVRYAPGSAFPEHTHGGGEEFVVVTGVFEAPHWTSGPFVPPHLVAFASGPAIEKRIRPWWYRRFDENRPLVANTGATCNIFCYKPSTSLAVACRHKRFMNRMTHQPHHRRKSTNA